LYYVDGDFMIEIISNRAISHYTQKGFHDGPAPGAMERSIGHGNTWVGRNGGYF
jgi:hypothetical protein